MDIEWNNDWSYRDKIYWSKIPKDIVAQLKEASKVHQINCQRRRVLRKHKYVYILGKSKKETEILQKKFKELNPDKANLKYPKSRGPSLHGRSNERVDLQKLTKRPTPCWPSNEEEKSSKKLYSIKEVAKMYGINQWLLYHHIKSDPTFPFVNVGVKKRFLINIERFDSWLENRSKKHVLESHNLPSSNELMEVGL